MEQVKNKQVEMWKWFKLPVDCSVVDKLDMSDAIGINLHETLSSHHAEKVEIAINSYDQNIELIAKQAEQIKMLREAIDNALRIKDLWQFANVGENYYEEQDLLNGMKSSLEQALSATEQE